MASTLEVSGSWTLLSDMISRIRQRWRLRLALHGLTIVCGAALAALLVGSVVLQLFHFDALSVVGVRIGTYVTLTVLIVHYVIRPLRRRADDTRVALYLEEHEPSLDAVVLSAVEEGTRKTFAFPHSPRFVNRLVDMAATRAAAIGNGNGIETGSIRRSLFTVLGIFTAGTLLVMLGPESTRLTALLLAAPRAKAEQHMFIAVQPGNATVSRSGNQDIRAQLHGFASHQAELVMQHGTGPWERLSMNVARDSAAFMIRLFDLQERTDYYIETGGVRSPTYHLTIVNLPYVNQIALDYHYPVYTGLANKSVEHGGDIAAPEGTSVIVHATPTMPVKGGRLIIPGQPAIPMMLGADGVLMGTLPVTAPGFYKIELESPNGSFQTGSLDYTIDVLKDNGPMVAFLKPEQDTAVAADDEVYTQVEATDDYGIATLELRYSVNGNPEQVIPLQTSTPRKDIVAGYTFVLKQLTLEPGDVVSYYAQATDNDAIHGGKIAKTNLYLLTVKALHRKAPKKGQKGQGQGKKPQKQEKNGDNEKKVSTSQLVRMQRQIMIGTFNADRDRAHMSATARQENVTTLTLAQSRLRDLIERLEQNIVQRGLEKKNPNYRIIIQELGKADEEMKSVEARLAESNEHAALSPEQRALQHLQRANEAYKNIPQDDQQQDGSQSNQQNQDDQDDQDQAQPDSTDLANMFDPKPADLSQQYTVAPSPQGGTDSTDAKLDEKLRELAQRQEQALASQQQSDKQSGQQQSDKSQSGQKPSDQQQAGKPQSGKQQSGQQSSSKPSDSGKETDKKNSGQGLSGGKKAGQGVGQATDGGDTQREIARETGQIAQQLQQRALEQPNARALRESAQQLSDAANAMRKAAAGGDPGQGERALEKLNEARRLLEQNRQNGGKGDARQQLLDRAHDLVRDAESLGDRVRQEQERKFGQRSEQAPGSRSGSAPLPQQLPQQFARESREQREAAERLQQALQQQAGGMKGDLKGLAQGLGAPINQMRPLETSTAYQDTSVVKREAAIIEGLKAWEYTLRKQLEIGNVSRPVLGNINDVPVDFKTLVSRYYESLAKKS